MDALPRLTYVADNTVTQSLTREAIPDAVVASRASEWS